MPASFVTSVHTTRAAASGAGLAEDEPPVALGGDPGGPEAGGPPPRGQKKTAPARPARTTAPPIQAGRLRQTRDGFLWGLRFLFKFVSTHSPARRARHEQQAASSAPLYPLGAEAAAQPPSPAERGLHAPSTPSPFAPVHQGT